MMFMIVFGSFGVVALEGEDIEKLIVGYLVGKILENMMRPKVQKEGCDAVIDNTQLYKNKECGSIEARKQFETCKQTGKSTCKSQEETRCRTICCPFPVPPGGCASGIGESEQIDCTGSTPRYYDKKTCAKAKGIYDAYANALKACGEQANVEQRINKLKSADFTDQDCTQLNECITKSVTMTQNTAKDIASRCADKIDMDKLKDAVKRRNGVEGIDPKDIDKRMMEAIDDNVPRLDNAQANAGASSATDKQAIQYDKKQLSKDTTTKLDGRHTDAAELSKAEPSTNPGTAAKSDPVPTTKPPAKPAPQPPGGTPPPPNEVKQFGKDIGKQLIAKAIDQLVFPKDDTQQPHEETRTQKATTGTPNTCTNCALQGKEYGELQGKCRECITVAGIETAAADAANTITETINNIEPDEPAEVADVTGLESTTGEAILNPKLKGILVDASQFDTRGFKFTHWNRASLTTKNFYKPERDLLQYYEAGPAVISTLGPGEKKNMFLLKGQGNDDLENLDGFTYKIDKDGTTRILTTNPRGALVQDEDEQTVWLNRGDTIYKNEIFTTNTEIISADHAVKIRPTQKTKKLEYINVKLGDRAPVKKKSIGITKDKIFTRSIDSKIYFISPDNRHFTIQTIGNSIAGRYEPHNKDAEIPVEYQIETDTNYKYSLTKGSTIVKDKNNKIIQDSTEHDVETLSNYQQKMLELRKK